MRTPERIVSADILKKKMTLLETLADIEVAVKVLQSGDQTMNPVDRHYLSLECDLKPMSKSDQTYSVSARHLCSAIFVLSPCLFSLCYYMYTPYT